MPKSPIIVCFIAACLVATASCGGSAVTWKIDVGMKNLSGVNLTAAYVEYGKVTVPVGALVNNTTAADSRVHAPIPVTAKVCFRTPDGVDQVRVVDVVKVIPADFDGRLFFTIRPDLTVTVDLFPRGR